MFFKKKFIGIFDENFVGKPCQKSVGMQFFLTGTIHGIFRRRYSFDEAFPEGPFSVAFSMENIIFLWNFHQNPIGKSNGMAMRFFSNEINFSDIIFIVFYPQIPFHHVVCVLTLQLKDGFLIDHFFLYIGRTQFSLTSSFSLYVVNSFPQRSPRLTEIFSII